MPYWKVIGCLLTFSVSRAHVPRDMAISLHRASNACDVRDDNLL
jgi:hypothetical protein